jgi:phage regulator Rha-like protein
MELITKEKITSLEIAETTGKNHYHVLRDIRKMEESWVKLGQSNFGYTCYNDSQGKKQFMFELDKTETLYIATKYSDEARGKLVLRWKELELLLQASRAKEIQRAYERNKARLGAPQMTDALKESRELEGKETKHFHYSNEFSLIYLIIFGEKKKKVLERKGLKDDSNLRDHLTPAEIKCVSVMQSFNTNLIESGYDYKERKKMLKELFNRKYQQKLLNELLTLEA